MKQFKKIVALMLVALLTVSCLVFPASAETTGKDYTIFMTDLDKFEVGANMKATMSSGSNVGTATLVSDSNGKYISVSNTFESESADGAWRHTYLKSGHNKWDFAWVEKVAAIKALSQYITVSVKYRVRYENAAAMPTNHNFYAYVTDDWNNEQFILASGSTKYNEWITKSTKLSATSLTKNFYSGFFEVRTEFSGGSKIPAGAVVTTDIAYIKLSINSADKDAVNSALSDAGVTDVTFSSLISPFTENYDIFATDLNKYNVGTDVKATMSSGSNVGTATVKSDTDGKYISVSNTFESESADGAWRHTYLKSGHNKWDVPWVESVSTIKALSKYITVSVKYRVRYENAAAMPTNHNFYAYVTDDWNNEQYILASGSTKYNEWITKSTKLSASSLTKNFYMGFFEVRTEFSGGSKIPAGAVVTTDIAYIKLSINSADEDAINADLAAQGSTYTFEDIVQQYATASEYIPEPVYNYKSIWTMDAKDSPADEFEYVNISKNTWQGGSQQWKDVMKMVDYDSEDESYYYSTDFDFATNSSGGDGCGSIIKGNVDNNASGYGWLADTKVLNAILPYLYFKFDYRVSGSVPSDARIYFHASDPYTYRLMDFGSVAIAGAENWKTSDPMLISSKDTPNFVTSWYSGFLHFNIYSYSAKLNGRITVDLRNLQLSFREEDADAINASLIEAGCDIRYTDLVNLGGDRLDTVYYASADRSKVAGANAGGKYEVTTVSDSTSYYTATFATKNSGGSYENAKIFGGVNGNKAGYGWMADKNVFNAIAPNLYLDFDYRVTGSKIPSDGKFYVRIAGKQIAVVNMSGASSWKTYANAKLSNTAFDSAWDGNIQLDVYSYSGGFDGSGVKVDIRNFKLYVKSSDKATINTALGGITGIKNVANFTKNVCLVKDSTGNYDFYHHLTYLGNSAKFDLNDDEVFNLADIVRAKKISAEVFETVDILLARADFNNDGLIKAEDLSAMVSELVSSMKAAEPVYPLAVSLETDHPGVVDMDADYTLKVLNGNTAVNASDVNVVADNADVIVDGYSITVPYSVRNGSAPLTVTVTSKQDDNVYGKYTFDFAKFTANATFEDDFDSIDTTKWNVPSSTTATASSGELIFTANNDGVTTSFNTRDKFEQSYGCFSARIKMPAKALANGAFWLRSNEEPYILNKMNPVQSGGEIDVVEYFPTWGDRWSSTVHWNGWSNDHLQSGLDNLIGSNIAGQYHVYSAVWTPDAIYSYIDGTLARVYTGAGVGNGALEVVLQLTPKTKNDGWGGTYDASKFPDEMRFDWVKVYGLE